MEKEFIGRTMFIGFDAIHGHKLAGRAFRDHENRCLIIRVLRSDGCLLWSAEHRAARGEAAEAKLAHTGAAQS